MHNDGKEYEQFVASLQQAILNSEIVTTQQNIKIELNKKIKDNCGNEREFDLYWEYDLGGLTYKTVIECKDYNSNISVEKIDALIGKVRDIPDLKAVFATKKGYQIGAKNKAEQNKIDLLVIREQNDTDWHDADGNPYVKEIHINMHLSMPAIITRFEPIIDAEWIKSNTKIDTSKPLNLHGLNNALFIEDLDKNEKYSLYDLAYKLSPIGNQEFGQFSKQEDFKNAFLYYQDLKLKIHSYKIEYSISKSLIEPIVIDFSKELVGVVEYLQKGTKKSIFRDGIIKDNNL
jgi:hypothetical protein